jgi:uncharacterized membrane protein YagU involved in acid resistance
MLPIVAFLLVVAGLLSMPVFTTGEEALPPWASADASAWTNEPKALLLTDKSR